MKREKTILKNIYKKLDKKTITLKELERIYLKNLISFYYQDIKYFEARNKIK